MIDIKVAVIRDVLPLYNITKVFNNPPTLQLTGDKFSLATLVLINDQPSPGVFKVSNTKILAQIPDSELTNIIKTVSVISDTVQAGKQSLLHFELKRITQVSGIQKLVQYFVKLLLQTAGTDRFNSTVGGNLLKIIGQNDIQDGRDIRTTVADSITRVKNYIVSVQTRNPRIPADEKLREVRVTQINLDPGSATIIVDLELTNIANQSINTNLTF